MGIGTNSPSALLDVEGNLRTNTLQIDSTICSGSNQKLYTDASGNLICGTDQTGISSESDPQVGSLTNGKWCTASNGQVICTSSAPSSGTLQCYQKSYHDGTYCCNTGYIIADGRGAGNRCASFSSGGVMACCRVA